MNIYLSAPITGRTADDNNLVFEYCATQLRYYGHFVINPWELGKCLPVLEHEKYMAIDFEIIKQAADAVFFAPGWSSSHGCRLEHDYAEALGLKIYHDIAEIAREAGK